MVLSLDYSHGPSDAVILKHKSAEYDEHEANEDKHFFLSLTQLASYNTAAQSASVVFS